MSDLPTVGRFIVITGFILIALGGVLILAGKVPFIGRLPGDIHIKRDNLDVYLPLGTSILISIILSLLLYIISKIR
ncbi:MAG: DUF2905 domain-containing protein [bacterium]